ncbi:T-cell immunoglobulin and mucin domain-containing protein 4 [Pipistrellus kuhlii]|uniref:T-cell immunoglobulin and mucin domain-containing protein 4 n=1 Tax=Pipistrellus kuhlii TaxID=59472 RepID=UPI00180DF4F7|nr:T-cell immunoglobulin and mucin domain-containing protein 4 [Pipistrellus kuhlii]KAF6347522.1 T cell immunoglobulin and mucin domain containing 4 [Pipistrellus kuhlii]
MSRGPVVLWLLRELWWLYLTPAAAQTVVTGYVGQMVTLPCLYSSWSPSNSMCWGKGSCPNSKCNEELLHTDGTSVLSQKSNRYQLWGNMRRGDVSLTILNTNQGDSATYCCRIEVPGWFNDVKKNIVLRITRAPTTTRRPTTTTTTTTTTTPTTTTTTTTTAMPTTTAVLPTTVMTTPDLTTGTPLQTRTTTALTTMTTTCPWTTPTSLPAATTVLLTTEPSTEGSTLTTATETTILMENEVEREKLSGVDGSFLAKIIAPSLGFVLCALIVALLLRGKVMKINCFQKHIRLHNVGESKNGLDDLQHGREDEDGLFTL